MVVMRRPNLKNRGTTDCAGCPIGPSLSTLTDGQTCYQSNVTRALKVVASFGRLSYCACADNQSAKVSRRLQTF